MQMTNVIINHILFVLLGGIYEKKYIKKFIFISNLAVYY